MIYFATLEQINHTQVLYKLNMSSKCSYLYIYTYVDNNN